MNFSRISFFVVLTAVVVYFGLNLLFPHRKVEPQLAGGPPADQVFGSTTADTPAPAADSAAAAPAAPMAAAAPEAPQPAPAQTAAAPAPEESAAPAPAETQTAAADSGASSPAPSGDKGGKTLTEAEARKIAEDVGRKVATEVTQQLLAQQNAKQASSAGAAKPPVSDAEVHRIAQAEVQKAVGQEQAAPAEPAPQSAAEAAPAPKPASKKEKPAPKEKPEKTQHAAAEPAKAAAPAHAAKDAHKDNSPPTITAWWAPASGSGSGFGLSFVGEAASARAIALLFNTPLGNPASTGSHIRVINPNGAPEPPNWALGANPRMLLLRVGTPGRYTVKVSSDITDAQGKALGTSVQGPVFVH